MTPVTLPKWPATLSKWTAGLLVTGLTACSYPGMTGNGAPPPPPAQTYRALGQEPGWTLTMQGDRIDYVGDYGETKISVSRPKVITMFNGHRYETPRLIVSISHGRCNDAMSGQGYADQVMVIAEGRTVHGCGGERRPDWDV